MDVVKACKSCEKWTWLRRVSVEKSTCKGDKKKREDRETKVSS